MNCLHCNTPLPTSSTFGDPSWIYCPTCNLCYEYNNWPEFKLLVSSYTKFHNKLNYSIIINYEENFTEIITYTPHRYKNTRKVFFNIDKAITGDPITVLDKLINLQVFS